MKKVQLKIAELRKGQGISQKELADRLSVTFQTVSKWENGTTMPDITTLPAIAEIFRVSVDELLGLKPLPSRDYIFSQTDTRDYWTSKSDYLTRNKMMFWNEDYFEFLVHSVWKIDKAVKILDFGCGNGFLGEKLLPLMPPGSSYTGIDINGNLIDNARKNFASMGYSAEFITCDLYDYIPDQSYDIAICQAVLRHLSRPKEILEKMTSSVDPGGYVICIEVNREFENAGLYVDGLDYSYLCTGFDYHKLWSTELEKQGRDYAIGFRTPFYMRGLGLHDIDVRMSDRVLSINPEQQNYHELLADFAGIHGWDQIPREEEREASITLFMNRGMSRAEAEAYSKKNETIRRYLHENPENTSLINFLGLVISCGRKQ